MPSKMDLNQRSKYGFLILDIGGNIEFDSLKKIETYINAETGNDEAKIILNLGNVDYISVTAVNELARITRKLAITRKDISLLNVNNDIHGILSRQGLMNFFTVHPDENSIMEKKRVRELNDILNIPSED